MKIVFITAFRLTSGDHQFVCTEGSYSAIHRIVIFSNAAERHKNNNTWDIEIERDKK